MQLVQSWRSSCEARSAGREFATAFMQNYLAVHEQPLFQLYISSLHSSCWVKVNVPGLHFTQESQLAAGQGITVTLPNEVELFGSKMSRKTALIQATDDVTVTSLNSKLYTADTSLLYPMSEWGTEYFIFTPSNSPPSMLKEFVLVNGKEQNIVEVFLQAAVRFEGRLYGVGSKLVVMMKPYENAQIQSQGDLTGTRVSSQSPIAVYSGHMCTWRFSKCNHVFEQLLPVQSWGTQFLVAPLHVQSQFDTVYIQASQSTNITLQSGHFTSTDILQRGRILEFKVQFPEGLHIIADKGIQVLFLFNGVRTSRGQLYDPFLINLLPNKHFCSSYALEGLAGFDNQAILIVSTNEQAGIHFDSLSLPRNTQWRVFKGSEYSWTELVYQPGAGRHIVSHPSASFGMYSVGIGQVNGYGSAAPCIVPDVLPMPRSCFGMTCSLDKECQMNGSYSICVKKPVGTCWAMGDPHYYTFDRRYFDFMGTCTYVLAKNCEANDILPAFEVLAKNENRGSTKVSYVARVTVNIGGITISAMSSEPGKVMVDQSMWSLPVFLDHVGVSVFQSGQFITILLSFGLSVQYDWNHYLIITLPTTFMNKVCGLCGNFNGDPNDDFAMPSSTQAHNVTELGRSWKVPNLALDEGCTDDCGGHCYGCDAQALRQWQKEEYCGLLIVEPFIQCHSIIDPSVYIQNCLYDVCMTEGHRYYLCKALEVYADACQRVGIQLTNWREAANCFYRCPENSHYELCGSACPLTCFGLGSPENCTLPCVETCICDRGFVLSGTKCVPSTHCGCSYNGHYISAGETFWVDDVCQRLCRCSEGRHLECEEVGCRAGQHCQVVNGIRDCYAISESTCIAMGDPHYYTFDSRSFDFQGNCVYQLVGLCATDPGLVPFDILVQNDFRESTVVSLTKLLEIKVYNISIVIDKDYYGYVTVNGELLNLPVHLIEGQVSVFKSGWSAVIQTSFGLKVTFDWNSMATVTLPSTYRGAVCGLCGNYNGNPADDLTLKESTLPASGPVEFGASWHVAEIPGCVHGCTSICPDCDPTTKRLYETSEFCGLLHDPQGPFTDCHATLDPAMYFENCVYDVCLYNGRRDVLCQAITAYVSTCQAMGISIGPWRTSQFCGVQCPIHSHYELCGSPCEVTCLNLAPPIGCHSFCKEGCVCDEGYILSGHRCVPLSQCGCLFDSRYYSFDQVFYPGTGCEQECRCMQYGQVVCNELSCGSSEKCELINGVRKCQPIGEALCIASGDPHYMTYDRLYYDFQGPCTYVLSQACGLEATNLSPFSIHVENERWPYTYSKLSVAKQVAMIIYGNTIILKKHIPQILVNGVLTNLPYSSNSLNGTLVQVYKDGWNYVMKTDFGLQVTYDLYYYVTVTIPGNYRSKTCGLCGNFDGIPSNDFRLPDGNVTHDVNEFGSAWKVDIHGVVCEDGCKENKCLVCDSKLKAIFEQRPYCGVLVDPNGPFARCHPVINPSAYLNNCVFDTCASDGSREVVCESVASYAQSCLTAGVDIDRWRTDSFCPMSCPANSHYELCADACAAACPGLTSIVQCPKTCTEGCTCDLGYLFNGQQCVQHQQCGCYEEGHTYEAGEVVYLNQCQKRCKCDPGQGLTCDSHTCANDTQCLLRDGVMACYHQDPCEDILCRAKETCRIEQGKAMCVPLYNATCWAWGDPHYHSFDGYDYDFQGTCKYILSQTCGNIRGLVSFSITQRNEYRDSLTVSYVREVEVFIYGKTLTMVRHQTAQIMVDGLLSYLPLDLHGGRLMVRHSGNAVVLVTDFGLRVHYDWDSEVYLQLPSSYYGAMCGLCGNFNGNSADELSDPAGNPLPSVSQWAKSWRAEDSKFMSDCHDGCETDCPVCPSDQQALYETQALCGALTTAQSVFVACHSKVNPHVFQHGCVYDLCLNHGDRGLLCQALESYINQCRLEGVLITDWREEFNCSMNCQPNSHYEACASPCPVTCPHTNQQTVCSDTCVEACVCNSGFILSAGTCVPADQCGCFFEGTYYQPGQSFWLDEGCHQLCECDRSLGVVVCRDSSCGPAEICSVVDGRRSCQPASTALCFATSDPHYRTFDGHHFDFQGTCVYQLAALCEDKEGLVPFNVTVQNEHRGNTAVSFPKTVNVFVNGFTVTMTREHPYQILFDGQLAQLPLSIPNEFMVYRSGNTAVLNTDFGLKVTFDWGRMASITIPLAYRGTVCGLCGNFNGVVEDDLTMCNGMMAPNVSSLGQSWQVAASPDCSSAGCHGNGCPTCTGTQRQVALDHCDIIINQTGPFRECHGRIDPWSYLEDCIFDTCYFQGHQSVTCDAVAAYASACQGEGLTVYPWRSATFCPLSCPTNSHYNLCAPGCTETCVNLFTDRSCNSPCTEACQCDHGYVLSGQNCVPLSECGCFYKGRYYEKHQKFYINEQCSELCICAENRTVECQASGCGTGETCGVVGGVLGCHPIDYGRCVLTGDPHYMSFDGRWFDFQGTCAYTLAKVCDQAGGRLVYFSVDTQNEGFKNRGVSVIKNLTVTVYNWTVGIRRGENWRVLVNNEFVNLPVSLDNRVMMNQVGFSVMLQTDFGLKVLYDTSYHAEVDVPSSYQGSMCGLCGNYNSNPTDDFLLPNGTQSASIDAFGQAWAVASSGDQCGGCEGNCQQCDQLKAEAYQGTDACGLIATDAGPFSACHDRVNTQPYLNNCVFDMCVVGGDRDILCQNLQAYAVVCQQAGAQIMPWRNESFCPPECPANSHYAQCTNNCANTCASLTSTGSCADICMEGCECDEGFVSDGDQCVSLGDCGCIHNGKYLRVGEVSVTDTCNVRCVCHTGGVLECVNQACATGEICDVQNGTRGCYPESVRCVFDTGDQLQTFDGVVGLVMSPGAFQMAFLCDEESPDWFRVVIDVRGCATSDPVNVTLVHVFIQGMIVTVNSHLHSWVNGKKVSYPIMPQEGVSVWYRNEAVVVESSDVRVTYSLADGVGLTVSRELMGKVCGACGNFNGDAVDDMTTSDGRSSSVMSEVVSSWQAEDFFTCDD
ncbi:IgGFc-binding protein isoform X2 [Triplophysa rosa]|uniref:IgGFc-binding protein isoform X2 n=1 Tax=Triplophysa rosa TaxID=992332 RepID=UPI002545FB7F|nr:IgGFc-binding protein isoform X2 [Triplophysa rosa]